MVYWRVSNYISIILRIESHDNEERSCRLVGVFKTRPAEQDEHATVSACFAPTHDSGGRGGLRWLLMVSLCG